MPNTPKVVYRVRKITIIHKQCPICHGTGKREVKFTGIFKTIDCQHCKKGVAEIEHMTEISLRDALNEIGIYNLIRNTVKDILTESRDAMHCVSTNTYEQTK